MLGAERLQELESQARIAWNSRQKDQQPASVQGMTFISAENCGGRYVCTSTLDYQCCARNVKGAGKREQTNGVSCKLALLRAHGILEKVSKSHRYRVTTKGRQALAAVLVVANATTSELAKLAA